MSKIVPATGWLLKNAPRTVKLLERDSSGRYILGEENRIGLEKLELTAPETVEVYRVAREFREVKVESELFFVHEKGKEGNPAYLSLINRETISAAGEKEIDLLSCPWYNWGDSSILFNRLQNTCGRLLFKNERSQQELYNMPRAHPLSQ